MKTRRQNSVGVLLRLPAFRRMWLALSVSSLGDWLGLLATTALAAYLTKNSSNLVQGAAVSGVLLTRLLPDLILGPIAGALVDRFDRRKVAIIGDSVAGLLYLSIMFSGSLYWLLAAQFLVEAVGLFSNPAKQALWVNIVPRERLAVANQLNYVSVYGMVPVAAVVFALLATTAQFFGAPPVPDAGATGALISGTSAVAIYIALALDAATYFLAAAVLFFTRHLIPAFLGERPPAKSVFSLIREGVGFVKNSRIMRAIYIGILGAFGAGGLVAGVAQAYVATLGAGNAGYGILFGTVFTGLAAGMLIGPKVLPTGPRRIVFTLCIGVAGCALVVMSLLQDFVGAAAASSVMGLFAGIAWITGFTMIGHEVSDRLRGRVFAFVMSSVRLTLLGTIAVGPILANSLGFHRVQVGSFQMLWSGPAIVLAASGLITMLVAVFAGRQVGGLRGVMVRRVLRRLLQRRRGTLLDAAESLPGALLAVVGPDPVATGRYAGSLVDDLAGRGWQVHYEAGGIVPTPPPGAAGSGSASADEPSVTPAEALRAIAALADLVTQRVRPALEAGSVVVCRDFVDAVVVHFGAQGGLDEERILRLARWATGHTRPDLTLLVDGSPDPPPASEPDASGGSSDASEPDGSADASEPGGSADASEPAKSADASPAGSVEAGGPAEPGDLAVPGAPAGPDEPEIEPVLSPDPGVGLRGLAEADVAADVAAAAAETSGAPAGEPDAEDEPVDPRRVYQDLAASAPERYLAVPPLADGQSIPAEVGERVASVLRLRSPVNTSSPTDTATADGTSDGATSANGAASSDAAVKDAGSGRTGAGVPDASSDPETPSPPRASTGGDGDQQASAPASMAAAFARRSVGTPGDDSRLG
jgi:dTMP kinase